MWVVLLVSGLLVWAGATVATRCRGHGSVASRSWRASVAPFSLEASPTKPSSGWAALGDHPESGGVEQLVHSNVGGFLRSQAC